MENFGFANFSYEGGQFGEKTLVFSTKNKNLNLKIRNRRLCYFNSSYMTLIQKFKY